MAAKNKFDARQMMERAIEVMKQSVNEPRADAEQTVLREPALLGVGPVEFLAKWLMKNHATSGGIWLQLPNSKNRFSPRSTKWKTAFRPRNKRNDAT